MELTIQVNPVERTVRLREVRALAAGDSCSVVLEGVRGADVSALRLALYRDAASDSPVASCPSFAPVRGHPNLATGDLRLDTAEMAAWFEAVRPEPGGSTTDKDGSRPGDTAERAVRTDGWLVVSEPTRTWAACRVPVVLRPGAGVSGVVDPTSIQSLVEGLVSAAISEALASKADKATTLAGYGITDAATKTELNAKADKSALAAKADKATTLAGYGITDAATKSELESVSHTAGGAMSLATETHTALSSKADKATTLAGYGITDAATKSELESVSHTAGGAMSLATETHTALSSKADLVDGKVPADQLPSYVDDVLEYDSVSAFPSTGEDGKIYVAKDTNKTYRWGGTQYVEISQSLALGETAETAYPGDKGKAAAELADSAYTVASRAMHDTTVHAENKKNPHAVTAAQVGALPIAGGTLTGDLALGEEHSGSRTLSIASDNGAQGIVLQGGTSNGEGGSVIIGGSSGRGGTFRVEGGGGDGGTMFVGGSPFTGGKLTVQGGGKRGGSIEVTEAGASIKKNGKEVATEEQLNAKADKATTLAGYGITDAATKTELNAKADKSALATKADKATTLAGYGITDGATKTELAALTAKVEYPLYAVPPTGVLKDRTLNTTSLASVTVPSNFTDLLIRASVTSSLSVTMPDAIATKYGDTFPGEAGEYLITITKTGAAEAYVRTIKLEAANA